MQNYLRFKQVNLICWCFFFFYLWYYWSKCLLCEYRDRLPGFISSVSIPSNPPASLSQVMLIPPPPPQKKRDRYMYILNRQWILKAFSYFTKMKLKKRFILHACLILMHHIVYGQIFYTSVISSTEEKNRSYGNSVNWGGGWGLLSPYP